MEVDELEEELDFSDKTIDEYLRAIAKAIRILNHNYTRLADSVKSHDKMLWFIWTTIFVAALAFWLFK